MRDGNDITYTVDDLTNRYTSIEDANLTYDAAGNLTKDRDGYEYEYDYENRIVKITKAGQTKAEFAYDALGRRVEKKDLIDPGNSRRYYYNYNWQVLCEFDGEGFVKGWFVYGNYIDEVLAMGTGPWHTSARFYIHDHLYSPAALTDYSGNVIERYEYDAYGNVQILDASYEPRETSDYNNPYFFTGRKLDFLDNGSLKIMYYRNRFYDTYTGRFTTHDPIGITPNPQKPNRFKPVGQYTDNMSLYEYINSNPAAESDPWGLQAPISIGIGLPSTHPPGPVPLTPPDCPHGGCPSGWLDPLPSSGGPFDDWHVEDAVAFYLAGGPLISVAPLPGLIVSLIRPDEVEFSHESTFAHRLASLPGLWAWSHSGALRDRIRSEARSYATNLAPCQCTSFGYSGISYEGYLISADDGIDDWMGLINTGEPGPYSELKHTVRCCVKKACVNNQFVTELVCRVRFDMSDKYCFEAPYDPLISRLVGRPFWHIIHFDKTLYETLPLP